MVAPVLLLNITSNTVSNVLLRSILHKPQLGKLQPDGLEVHPA